MDILWERHVEDDIAMASKLRSYQPAGCLRGVSVRYLVRTPRVKMLFWICFRLHLPACIQISCFGTKKLMHILLLQSKPVEICKNHQAIKDAAQFTMDSWQDLPVGAEDTRSQCEFGSQELCAEKGTDETILTRVATRSWHLLRGQAQSAQTFA